MSLLRLLPGVRYENDIEAMGDSFGSSVPNIGGQRRAWNQVTVDGMNGNELSGTARFSSAINLDAIAEVKVLLNTYKAEFGRSGGANIQIVSKSGSVDYRGSGYWYARREAWNATPWENNRSGLAKPKYHIDTPGFNFGGPLKIPGLINDAREKKVFFFYSLEAPQVQRPGQVRLYRMPTELERRGDFSQTRNAAGQLIFIKDPNNPGACSVRPAGQAAATNVIRRIGSTPTHGGSSTRCRCESARPQRDRELELPASKPPTAALEQPAARRRPSSGSNAFGERCRRSTRTNADRRSRPVRRSGATSTAPTSSRTAR